MHPNRNRMIFFRIGACLLLFFMVQSPVSLGFCRDPDGTDKISVFVSILPQRCFVRRIGGERVHVSTMVPPGANPATYEPRPSQMMALMNAKAYFAAGVPFEKAWLDRIASANPRMRIVHTDAGIKKRTIEGHGRHETVYRFTMPPADPDAALKKPTGHVHEAGKDPHTWLSPPLAKIHARNILHTLEALDPRFKKRYRANYQQLETEMDATHHRLKSIFSNTQGKRAFMVFHPAWGYFADTYGLKQIPVEMEGKAPKPADLQRLVQWARSHRVNVIFVQKQFPAKSAAVIAQAIDGHVVFVDPLAEQWSENLVSVANIFKKALR